MIMEMVGNHSFTLTTGNNKRSRLQHLKNGFPQGGIRLGTSSFQHLHLWLSNHPLQKYAYANDLAIRHAYGGWQAVLGVLSKDMATVGKYFQA